MGKIKTGAAETIKVQQSPFMFCYNFFLYKSKEVLIIQFSRLESKEGKSEFK